MTYDIGPISAITDSWKVEVRHLKTTHTIAFVECLDLDLVPEFEWWLENVDNGLKRWKAYYVIRGQSFGNMLKSPLWTCFMNKLLNRFTDSFTNKSFLTKRAKSDWISFNADEFFETFESFKILINFSTY